jgi:hypothetical protein
VDVQRGLSFVAKVDVSNKNSFFTAVNSLLFYLTNFYNSEDFSTFLGAEMFAAPNDAKIMQLSSKLKE